MSIALSANLDIGDIGVKNMCIYSDEYIIRVDIVCIQLNTNGKYLLGLLRKILKKKKKVITVQICKK